MIFCMQGWILIFSICAHVYGQVANCPYRDPYGQVATCPNIAWRSSAKPILGALFRFCLLFKISPQQEIMLHRLQVFIQFEGTTFQILEGGFHVCTRRFIVQKHP